MTELTINKLSNDLLDQYTCNEGIILSFQQINIKVKTNSKELVNDLRNYFREFLSEKKTYHILVYALEGNVPDLPVEFQLKKPDPGKTKIKEAYFDVTDGRIVKKRLTGMMFLFGNGINIGIGPCVKNSNQIVNFINNRYIEWMLKHHSLLFHSSGVIQNGKGILFSGFSGAGKSTLALHLLTKNLLFLSNDRVMVNIHNDQLKMFGVPKLPRVNPGTLLSIPALEKIIPDHEKSKFLRLSKDELWHLEHKYDVFIDENFGKKKFILESEMHGLVILNWKRNNEPFNIKRIDLQKRDDVMPAFIKSPGLFFLVNKERNDYDFSKKAYQKLLKTCPIYEITGGVDFDKAVNEVLNILS